MPRKKSKSKRSGLTRTSKMGPLKGVGSYSRTAKHKGSTRRVKGHGGYAEDIGSGIGSWLGQKAGSLFKSITGLGTYHVTKNSLSAEATDPPVLSNTPGATRVQHREYIQDILCSEVFTLNSFPINPGLSQTFPWLAGIAGSFEEYILHGIMFEYKSLSATALNSTHTNLGSVIMATEYNSLHNNFSSKRDMENYMYSTSNSPDTSALHPVECARDVNVLTELYVRNVPPASNSDLRFSDLGNFQIATVGMQSAGDIIGELWCTYDVELIKPKLPDAYTSIGPAHYVFDASSGIPYAGSIVPNAGELFGVDGSQLALFGTGNTPVALQSSNVIRFLQPGRYMVGLYIFGGGSLTALAHYTITPTPEVVAADIFVNAGVSGNHLWTPDDTETSTQMIDLSCWDVMSTSSSATARIIYSSGTIPPTVGTLHLLVIPLPQGFTARERTEMEVIREQISKVFKVLAEMNPAATALLSRETQRFLAGPPGGPSLLRSNGRVQHDYEVISPVTSTTGVTTVPPPPPVSQQGQGLLSAVWGR